MKGIPFCSNEGPRPFLMGDNSENTMTTLKNLLLQNNWAYFKDTCRKVSLGKEEFIKRDSNEGSCLFSTGDNSENEIIH